MTTIMEVDEANSMHSQTSDLPVSDELESMLNALSDGVHTSQSHLSTPVEDDYSGHGFVSGWNLPEPNNIPVLDLEEPDYSKFENWIPLFYRPKEPCAYCRTRRLNCYVQRGEAHCTPCKSLFRDCSMSLSNTLEATNYVDTTSGTFIDTLSAVDEDLCIKHGTLTGVKAMRSKVSNGNAAVVRDDAPGSSKRNGIRFPRNAVKVLREWLATHSNNPYPTEEEKVELEQRTELTQIQINNWLANARRRKKAIDASRVRPAASPSLKPVTPAIDIPKSGNEPWQQLDPLERWKNSPPEHEPAAFKDIINAVAEGALEDTPAPAPPSTLIRRDQGSSAGSAVSYVRALSTTSQETIQSSSISASSAAFSRGSSRSVSTYGSFGSFSSSLTGRKDRRKRRRSAVPTNTQSLPVDQQKRIFQCTFCTDSFRSKYDWTRHEKSLHISLEKWVCATHGPTFTDESTGVKHCSYCNAADPTEAHIESHNHSSCAEKGHEARTFYRKDHLRQHLRLVHGCGMLPHMEKWKHAVVNINSRCGFCAQRFSVWQDRVDHLTAHFKAGARMIDWKGCRGFDPAWAATVKLALPPYLIGMETVSPAPFSATNQKGIRHMNEFPDGTEGSGSTSPHSNLPPAAIDLTDSTTTCWEVLTVKLGRYAREMAEKGEVMTDEMLQAQARCILYGSDDPWNQTAADNAEWLDLFKKAHGLNFIPHHIGGQGASIPEDLETYGDLGLRIPFAVQLQAYIDHQRPADPSDEKSKVRPGPMKQILYQRRATLRAVYQELVLEGVLYEGEQTCLHAECGKNVIDLTMIDESQPTEPQLRRWCKQTLSKEKTEELERIVQRVKPQPSEALALMDQSFAEHGTASDDQAGGLNDPMSTTMPLLRDEPVSTSTNSAINDRGYIPRHKLSLPPDVATRFSTVTGAWTDAGAMPAPMPTAATPSTAEEQMTSTGAMMEFLGGLVGRHLPFSGAQASASISLGPSPTIAAPMAVVGDAAETMQFPNASLPWSDVLGNHTGSTDLSSDPCWPDVDGQVHDEDGLLRELDLLIEATGGAEASGVVTTAGGGFAELNTAGVDSAWTTGEANPSLLAHSQMGSGNMEGLSMDLDGQELRFDEGQFDGVFDMTMDEDFDCTAIGP